MIHDSLLWVFPVSSPSTLSERDQGERAKGYNACAGRRAHGELPRCSILHELVLWRIRTQPSIKGTISSQYRSLAREAKTSNRVLQRRWTFAWLPSYPDHLMDPRGRRSHQTISRKEPSDDAAAKPWRSNTTFVAAYDGCSLLPHPTQESFHKATAGWLG